MNNAKTFFYVSLFATVALQFASASAFHEPGHIPPTGTCRDPECAKPCDDKLLKELKARRDQKIKTYREIVAAAEDTRQREAEALAEAQQIFGKYMEDVAVKGQMKVQNEWFQIPESVRTLYKASDIASSSDPWSKKMLKLAKAFVEQLGKQAGYGKTVERAKWIDAAVSGLLMDAMVVMKLNEADTLAQEAFEEWLRGNDALTEARHLEDRIKKLEAQCKKKSDSVPPANEGDDYQSSGEREAERARQMLESWKKVESGFIDAQGNFHDADMAFEEALSIVQGRQSSRIIPNGRLYLVTEQSEASLEVEWNKFKVPMTRAHQQVEKALNAFHLAESEFNRLGHR